MAGRERRISAEAEQVAASFKIAVAQIALDRKDVIWIESHGQTVAVIMPARNYHAPDRCCCSNCPWNGNHGN